MESIENAVVKWFEYCRRFTQSTRQHYEMVLGYFLAGLPKDIAEIQQLKPIHVQGYISSLLENFTNRTGNSHLTAVKSFCRWLSLSYDIPNIAERIKMLKEDPPKRRFITQDEYHKLLAVADETIQDVIRFIANTGIRADEWAGLTCDCISHNGREIRIVGKGRHLRIIPLNKTCRAILSKHKRRKKGLVGFVYCRRNALYQRLLRLSERAGIPTVGPHSLRRYFATRLCEQGVSLIYVSAMLGHRSIKTTELYLDKELNLDGITEILNE